MLPIGPRCRNTFRSSNAHALPSVPMNTRTATHLVPRLLTAQTGPLLQLESTLLDRAADIETWFRQQWQHTAPPFYSSVDLRNAGFKLAPVDTNLFPGGLDRKSTRLNSRH